MRIIDEKELNEMRKLDRHYFKLIDIYDTEFGDNDTFEKIITDKRHDYINRERDNSNLKVLDLGSGTGVYLPHISLISKDVYGCDLSRVMLNRAKIKCPNVKFAIASAENLPYPSNYFDVVFCFNSFYHFNNQRKALKEISRVLKKEGRAYIEFYNKIHPFVIIRQFLNFITTINSRGSHVGNLRKSCNGFSLDSKIEIMSFIEPSSSVKKFLPSFMFNIIKRLENIKLPHFLFFRGMLICKKKINREL